MIVETNRAIKNQILEVLFDAVINDTVYGKLKLEFIQHVCHIHFEAILWGHRFLKQTRHDLYNDVIKFAKAMGASKLVATFTSKIGDTAKWMKYIKALGLPDPEVIYISEKEI